jgi:hypothetical protein
VPRPLRGDAARHAAALLTEARDAPTPDAAALFRADDLLKITAACGGVAVCAGDDTALRALRARFGAASVLALRGTAAELRADVSANVAALTRQPAAATPA